MNTYVIELNDGYKSTGISETAAKAKYALFKRLSDVWDWDKGFLGFLKDVKKCSCLHKFRVRDLFNDDDTFANVKKLRNIEFVYIGMKVEMCGKKGTIVGGNSSLNLNVCFDGEFTCDNCHPCYMMKYFDEHGNIIKEYKD